MPSITQLDGRKHESLPGIAFIPLSDLLRAGDDQRVLVRMAPHAIIPLHTHSVAARMTIVAGSAHVLSTDATNGAEVETGQIVFFEEDAPHGFLAGRQGMTFLSENGGILDDRGDNQWDITFTGAAESDSPML